MKSLNSYPQFLELARNRYSCRKFDSRPVYRGLILAVIEAAQLALRPKPAAMDIPCNRRWGCTARSGCKLRTRLDKHRPVYIVALGDKSQAWVRPVDGKNHMDVDLSIAIEHMCLAATSLRLRHMLGMQFRCSRT